MPTSAFVYVLFFRAALHPRAARRGRQHQGFADGELRPGLGSDLIVLCATMHGAS